MTHQEIIKNLRKNGVSWEEIARGCGKKESTIKNWASENHNGPGKSADMLLRQFAVTKGVL